MNRIFIILLSIFLFACEDEHEIKIDYNGNDTIPAIIKKTLPKNPDTLRILGIGNSFTDDAMAYIPNFLSAAGINNVILGKLSYMACSLSQHAAFYNRNSPAYNFQKSTKNKWETISTGYSLEGAIKNEPWDIIIFQQVSQNSGMYDTFQPHLNYLINSMNNDCYNKDVLFGWHMTWSYSSNSKHSGFKNYGNDQNIMYQKIVDSVKAMMEEIDIDEDLIIPSGTAFQNLRNTSVNNPPLDLTRDGYHADLGVGRYILAYTWYQTLVAPCFDNLPPIENSFKTHLGFIPVTDSNYKMCQEAVHQSCKNKFEVVGVSN